MCMLWCSMVTPLVKNFRYYLGNKIYFAEQLCFDMVEGNEQITLQIYQQGGIFVYACSSATRTVEIKNKRRVALHNFKVTIAQI